jgi:hypothetical protein
MENNKVCPLSGKSCDKEYCAWWNEYREKCSVTVIAINMSKHA